MKYIKKYPVALGKISTPTPDYKFTIINKIKILTGEEWEANINR